MICDISTILISHHSCASQKSTPKNALEKNCFFAFSLSVGQSSFILLKNLVDPLNKIMTF